MIYIIKFILLAVLGCIYLIYKAPIDRQENIVDLFRVVSIISGILIYGVMMILFYLNDIDKKIKQ
jgi:hypothetical protein